MMDLARILVATDFDAASAAAVDAAADLACATGASVHLLSVLEALMYTPKEIAAFAERDPRTHPEVTRKMEVAIGRLRERGVKEVDGSIEFGIPVDVILRHANEGRFGLLLIGSRRHGSSAAYVIPRSRIPVMAVPSPWSAP
jgi:nucleotide-binding universal stress UspA family protein